MPAFSRARAAVDDIGPGDEQLRMVAFGMDQLKADTFELGGGRSRKDFDLRPVLEPPVCRSSKRTQREIRVSGGNTTSG
jgi:hypothetical protein